MSKIEFPHEQTCPLCQGTFTSAEKVKKFDPVPVVRCPHCEKMLWRPGLEDSSPVMHPFDPDADDGI